MGQHHCHSAIVAVQTFQHVQHKGIVALGTGGNTNVKALIGIHGRSHLLLLFALGIQAGICKEATVPFIQAEWRICHHYLETRQLIVL